MLCVATAATALFGLTLCFRWLPCSSCTCKTHDMMPRYTSSG